MSLENPYLSVVAASRNDDHGKNLHRRMQIFVNGFFEQCHRFQLPAELIMVDWNPPADKPPLAEALSWPVQDEFCSARIIQVPPAIHRRFAHSEALPLFQMIAKNVGIRRARGKFILATNIDILFNDALMQFIASRKLHRGVMYRINRYDASEDVPLDATIEEQLTFCENHLIRINAKLGTSPISAKTDYFYSPSKAERLVGVLPHWAKQLYSDIYERTLGKSRPVPPQADPGSPKRALPLRTAWTIFKSLFPNNLKHQTKQNWMTFKSMFSYSLKHGIKLFLQDTLRLRLIYKLAWIPHLNACGDFTLMDRAHWFEIQGYPEDAIFSMHLDSLLCVAAWHRGIREEILYDPMRVYHIEHSTGSGFTPEGWNTLVRRLEAAGIPQLSYERFKELARQMRHEPALTRFNYGQWGLSCENLDEKVISPAAR